MKKCVMQFALCLVLLMNSGIVLANMGVAIASGNGTNKSKAYRISLQQSWGHACATANKRMVHGYWEASFSRINAKKIYTYPTNHHVQVGSLSAAVRLLENNRLPVYLDLSLGAAFFSNQNIAARNLGSRWLFEDRLGVGLLFGKRKQIDIGYRFVHYSNAYLAQVNNGLNLHLMTLGYWFN